MIYFQISSTNGEVSMSCKFRIGLTIFIRSYAISADIRDCNIDFSD